MNPLLYAALGSIVRFLLASVFGALVARGIWTQEEAATYLSAAVVAVLTIGWSLWKNHHGRLKLLTALASDEPMTEHEVEKEVAAKRTPSPTTPKGVVPQVLDGGQ